MGKLASYWLELLQSESSAATWWKRKKELNAKRNASIVRIQGKGQIFQHLRYRNEEKISYMLHVSFLTKQKEQFYLEERVIPYQFTMKRGEISQHQEINVFEDAMERATPEPFHELDHREDHRFNYDRHAAVQYAERWWNSYNPAYHTFHVDCTNFISQCLHAGGAPMRGAPNRGKGWWYGNDNWSYSWAVAHSLRWYLSGSTQGLRGKELQSPEELLPGDVICYDFEGDGRFDHNTIVVAKDADGMPLVNAHTDNSRLRYWSYEDSTAWTPEIKYKFFQIG